MNFEGSECFSNKKKQCTSLCFPLEKAALVNGLLQIKLLYCINSHVALCDGA